MFSPSVARAQAQSAAVSGQTATQVLTNSLNAMGGAAAWSQVIDATVTGSCASTVNGSDQTPYSFIWISAQNEFRYESDPGANSSVMLSGHGKPKIISASDQRFVTNETVDLLRPFHLPGLVLAAELADSHYSASIVGLETVLGEATVHTRIVHRLAVAPQLGSTQDWWFDASTNLPVKVMYLIPGQTLEEYMPMTVLFSNWSAAKGALLIPHQLSQSLGEGIDQQSCSVNEVQTNTQPAPALFDAR